MEGRIGNRALLSQLADVLKLEGIQQAPKMANLDQVQCVLDISQFLYSTPLATPNEGMGLKIALLNERSSFVGNNVCTMAIVGSRGEAGEVFLPIAQNYAYRFENMTVKLTLTSAGATSWAGKILQFKLMTLPSDDSSPKEIPVVYMAQFAKIEAGKLEYVWSMLEHSTSLADGTQTQYGASSWDGVHICEGYLRYDGLGTTTLNQSSSVSLYAIFNTTDLALFPSGSTASLACIGRRGDNGIAP